MEKKNSDLKQTTAILQQQLFPVNLNMGGLSQFGSLMKQVAAQQFILSVPTSSQ